MNRIGLSTRSELRVNTLLEGPDAHGGRVRVWIGAVAVGAGTAYDRPMTLDELLSTESWEWPESARDTILAAMADTTLPEKERAAAISLASDIVVMDDDVARRLIAMLQDPSLAERLRGAAAIALGPILEMADIDGFDDPGEIGIQQRTFVAICAALRAIHDDPGQPTLVRRRALEASVRAPADWHPAAIRAALAIGDPTWKVTAVFAMGLIRGFETEILAALDDASPEVRHEAVRAAGAASLKAAWKRIVALLDAEDTERDLLIAAIEAAASIDPKRAPSVIRRFRKSPDDDIANAAEAALEEASIFGQGE